MSTQINPKAFFAILAVSVVLFGSCVKNKEETRAAKPGSPTWHLQQAREMHEQHNKDYNY